MKKTERKPKKEKLEKHGRGKEVKFNRLAYRVLMICCFIYRKRLGGRVVQSDSFRAQKKKGAMLVLCNHVSALDFFYFTPPMRGAKVNFVVAENMSYSKPIFAKFLKIYHTITKKQYYADFQCIKNIKRYLDAGISVVLCPEGKVAAEGRTGYIPDSAARLIQWLGYPVATMLTKGGGLVRPKWAYTTRKGEVATYCDMLLDATQTKSLSKEEISARVRNALEHNENEYQIKNAAFYKGDRYAEGLEKLLYRCPRCGTEFAMVSEKENLRCLKCGNIVVYTHTGKLLPLDDCSVCPERIDLWCEEEKQAAAKLVKSADFRLSNPVNLFIENEKRNGYKYIATGMLTLDKYTLRFDTEQKSRMKRIKLKPKSDKTNPNLCKTKGETVEVEEAFKHISFDLKNCVTAANIPGDSIDMSDENHTYRMAFTDCKASTLYTYAIEALNSPEK